VIASRDLAGMAGSAAKAEIIYYFQHIATLSSLRLILFANYLHDCDKVAAFFTAINHFLTFVGYTDKK
jgi:hypothetical protein